MAHIDTGGHGRKPVVELNLVPFIDLMSVLITFLLISAVWSQVSMMQIGSSIYGKKTNDVKVTPPPDADVVLRLDVKSTGYILTVGAQPMSIVKKDGTYDILTLDQQLEIVKSKYPNKKDAVITMEDELLYGALIDGMDALIRGGFIQVSVATGGG